MPGSCSTFLTHQLNIHPIRWCLPHLHFPTSCRRKEALELVTKSHSEVQVFTIEISHKTWKGIQVIKLHICEQVKEEHCFVQSVTKDYRNFDVEHHLVFIVGMTVPVKLVCRNCSCMLVTKWYGWAWVVCMVSNLPPLVDFLCGGDCSATWWSAHHHCAHDFAILLHAALHHLCSTPLPQPASTPSQGTHWQRLLMNADSRNFNF